MVVYRGVDALGRWGFGSLDDNLLRQLPTRRQFSFPLGERTRTYTGAFGDGDRCLGAGVVFTGTLSFTTPFTGCFGTFIFTSPFGPTFGRSFPLGTAIGIFLGAVCGVIEFATLMKLFGLTVGPELFRGSCLCLGTGNGVRERRPESTPRPVLRKSITNTAKLIGR